MALRFEIRDSDSDIPVQIGRCAFLLVVTFAFPLLVYPCRMNLRTLLFRRLKRDNVFHVIATTGIVVTAYAVAASGVPLGLVFGLLGATCGNWLIYIFPGALYVKLSDVIYLFFVFLCIFLYDYFFVFVFI